MSASDKYGVAGMVFFVAGIAGERNSGLCLLMGVFFLLIAIFVERKGL